MPDQRIQSTVSNGRVTLEGEVDFWHEREDTGIVVPFQDAHLDHDALAPAAAAFA